MERVRSLLCRRRSQDMADDSLSMGTPPLWDRRRCRASAPTNTTIDTPHSKLQAFLKLLEFRIIGSAGGVLYVELS
jgi:hypothetical protein